MNLHREIHFEEPICEYLGVQDCPLRAVMLCKVAA